MYECKTVHAYWDGLPTSIIAYFTVNGGDTDNSSYGIENLFTQASVEKKPTALSGKVDVWQYDKCNPVCGKDAAGKWQAPQEVARGGTRAKNANSLNFDRLACTSNDGKNGPTVSNPTNSNTKGEVPPGN
jgi:hypothetical protein